MLGSALSFLVVGVFLVLITLGLVTAAISSAFSGITDEKVTSVKDNSVLHLKFDGPIVERMSDRGQEFNFMSFQPETGFGLNHIIENLRKAKDDERIEGLFLDMGSVMASPSTMEDVRNAISDFKSSGKWVIAFSEGYGQGAYYLASAADEVYLYPEGGVNFYGLGTELMFFKKMLDNIGVDVQVIRGPNNKYKSAVEGFIREDMSPENREQIEAFLYDIWNDMVAKMAVDRNMTVAQLNGIADNLSIRVARHAEEFGLVDGLRYRDEVMQMILDRSGLEADEDDEEKDDDGDDEKGSSTRKSAEEKVRFVSHSSYTKAKLKSDDDKKKKKKEKSWKKDRVAVVYAVGAIESGQGDDQTIGSERIASALREARLDEKVKAIVLRVNSPGGSALASDVIWRETVLIREAGKPLVVSMGDLAASGGYYISAGADKIFANATTITGSIGVFGMIPNMERMLEDKIGLTFDRVSTNAHGNPMTVTRALDEVEFEAINESVIDIYETFVNLVADGRDMSYAEVDAIAQGRVWTGSRAQEIGLVDEIGNLQDAIEYAAEAAGIDDYITKELPKMMDPFEELIKSLTGETTAARVLASSGVDQRYLTPLLQAQRMVESNDRVQARLPFHLIFD